MFAADCVCGTTSSTIISYGGEANAGRLRQNGPRSVERHSKIIGKSIETRTSKPVGQGKFSTAMLVATRSVTFMAPSEEDTVQGVPGSSPAGLQRKRASNLSEVSLRTKGVVGGAYGITRPP